MKKPIKIVFDASPLLVNKTGVAYYIERTISQLAARYPNDVELVGFYYNFLGRRSANHFPQAKNIRYRPVRFIPSKVIYQLRRFGIEIPLEVLTKERADFALFGNFLGYPSLYKTPAAPVVHDLTYLDIPEYVAAKNRSDLTRFIPQQIKRSKFVVTVSAFSKKKIEQYYRLGPDKVLVTPIPPPQAMWLNKAVVSDQLAQLNITKPFILFLSTIEPRKNLVNLIDAYAKLPAKLRTQYSLVIAGRTGWNCDAEITALSQAKANGLDIIHVGYISDDAKAVLYQSATLYVNSSSYEGFGMPILEAMSYGCPCALSDIEVFHEVAGHSARYFNHQSAQSISQTLQVILTDAKLQKELHTAGERQVKRFDWAEVADSIYKKITQTLA